MNSCGGPASRLCRPWLRGLFPTLAVGRIGKHEGEFFDRERVVREGGVLGAAYDMVGVIAFALEEHVGLADGVGFGVDLLAVEVGADLLPLTKGDGLQGLFRNGKHAPGAASAVV